MKDELMQLKEKIEHSRKMLQGISSNEAASACWAVNVILDLIDDIIEKREEDIR